MRIVLWVLDMLIYIYVFNFTVLSGHYLDISNLSKVIQWIVFTHVYLRILLWPQFSQFWAGLNPISLSVISYLENMGLGILVMWCCTLLACENWENVTNAIPSISSIQLSVKGFINENLSNTGRRNVKVTIKFFLNIFFNS